MTLFFSRWILVTSLGGAPAVNFLSPNFTLHVQIIVNMLFMVLLFLFCFIYLLPHYTHTHNLFISSHSFILSSSRLIKSLMFISSDSENLFSVVERVVSSA